MNAFLTNRYRPQTLFWWVILLIGFAAAALLWQWSYADHPPADKSEIQNPKSDIIEQARLYAEADKLRADAICEIVGRGDAYLQYLWINSLANSKATVIYVPIEGGIPLCNGQPLWRPPVADHEPFATASN